MSTLKINHIIYERKKVKGMKTKNVAMAIMVVIMVLVSASFVLADDINVRSTNNNNLTNTNNIETYADAYSYSEGGKAVVINKIDGDKRQFVGLPAGGLQLNLIAPSTRTSHRTNDGTGIVEYGYFTQSSYDGMKSFMDRVHAKYPNTRTWADIEENLVIQPRFDHPRAELADNVPVRVYANSNYTLKGIRPENVVGYVTVRDLKPQENSVDSMYFVVALYPIAKMGGANVLIKVDNYFWQNVASNSWGIGAGAGWSQILSCLTGFSAAGNLGYNQGKAVEKVAGGEMYLALYVPDAPAPVIVPVVKPEPVPQAKICNPDDILDRIKKIERKLKKCTTWCMNNLGLREEAGDEDIEAYICTGHKKYLFEAIEHYGMAEKNYFNGPDVKSYKSEAREIMARVYYNWAGCIYELYGHEAARKFAAEKHLERFPTGFAR